MEYLHTSMENVPLNAIAFTKECPEIVFAPPVYWNRMHA